MTISDLRTRIRRSRPLTIAERAMAAVTASLALATIALSISGSADASPAGELPEQGAYSQAPLSAISHDETEPGSLDQSLGD